MTLLSSSLRGVAGAPIHVQCFTWGVDSSSEPSCIANVLINYTISPGPSQTKPPLFFRSTISSGNPWEFWLEAGPGLCRSPQGFREVASLAAIGGCCTGEAG